jgi:hypothetical protein
MSHHPDIQNHFGTGSDIKNLCTWTYFSRNQKSHPKKRNNFIPFKMMQVNTSKSAAHQIQGTKFRACSGGKVPLKNTGPAAVGRRFWE